MFAAASCRNGGRERGLSFFRRMNANAVPAKIIISGSFPVAWERQAVGVGIISQLSDAPHATAIMLSATTGAVK